MENLSDLFVPYKIALRLKEIGFNEPCLAIYNNSSMPFIAGNTPVFNDKTEDESIITAPIYEQVVDWLSKEHDVHISIYHSNDDYNDYRVRIYKTLSKSTYTSFYLRNGDNNLDEKKIIFMFNSHKEALKKAIEESLKLI